MRPRAAATAAVLARASASLFRVSSPSPSLHDGGRIAIPTGSACPFPSLPRPPFPAYPIFASILKPMFVLLMAVARPSSRRAAIEGGFGGGGFVFLVFVEVAASFFAFQPPPPGTGRLRLPRLGFSSTTNDMDM